MPSLSSLAVARDISDDDWHPLSWQTRTDASGLAYPDPRAVAAVASELAGLPPLVALGDVEMLKARIAEAQRGHLFLLQAGSCAERFNDCDPEVVRSEVRMLRDLGAALSEQGRPVICVGRIAGQYAKPRSNLVEDRGGTRLPSYFGDLYNGLDFRAASRQLDPERMRVGYECAAETLKHAAVRGTSGAFWTSHEGLNLHYESALTRYVDVRHGYYDLSTHMPWIGERTRAIDGAHVEFFRGIRNPIGIKLGPRMTPSTVLELIDALNPRDEPGRLVLITRMGEGAIEAVLPRLIDAVRRAGRRVLWVCDPMHGNTETTASGIKTRRFERIAREVELSSRIHAEHGVALGGLHLEVTGYDVTECVGQGVAESDLGIRYTTACDPRLNRRQALELVSRLVRSS